MLSLVPTLVFGRSVLRTIAATYCTSRRRHAVPAAASATRYFPRSYSRSSDSVNDEDGSSSSSSSSDDSDGEDDDEGVDPAAKPVIQKPKDDIPVGEEGPAPHQAMSSKLLDQILSMKVTRNRRIGKHQEDDDPDHPVEAEDAKDGNEDDESDDARHLVLAKPTAKFRQIRNKLQEEHEAEKELEKSGLNKELITAIKDVASSVSGDPVTIESELLTKLKDHGLQTNASRAGMDFNLGEMVTGMKIDRSPRTKRSPASEQPERSRFLTDRTLQARQTIPRSSASHELSMKSMRPVSKVDLFGAPPLNIFSAEVASHDAVQQDVPRLWERLERRELDLLVLHPPANGFEEMITWTRQGKLWHFPIDNEQGMDEEAKVGFHEHVFLEPLIADGFPKKGPIRHFMELVAVGLSKNPYLSVTRKREHIDWFRQYFKDKANVLEEVGALD